MNDQTTHFLSRDAKAHMKRRQDKLKKRSDERDAVMRMIFSRPGFAMVLAKQLGVTHQNISQWNRVPAHHVLELAPILELSPEKIRPDIFGRKRK